MKKWNILVLAACVLCLCVGCAFEAYPEGTGSAELARASLLELLDGEDVTATDEAENNGGNFVRYQGDVYYWKYSAETRNSTGVFMRFSYESVNSLVCRHADGSETVLLTEEGSGSIYSASIYIVGSRIYLQNGTSLYSVALDGSDRQEHGELTVWAADEASGTLLGRSPELGAICRLDAQTGDVEPLTSEEGTLCGVLDGICYYSVQDADYVGFTLYAMSADGQTITTLDHVSNESEPITSLTPYELTRVGDRLYYSYGYYAGTGGYFQGGGINSVSLSGGDSQVCVDYGELTAEEFLVEQAENGDIILYYIGGDDVVGTYVGFWKNYPYSECIQKNLTTGVTAESSFRLSKSGSFVCMDGVICRQEENQAAYEVLIPQTVSVQFGFQDQPDGTEDSLTIVSQLDVIGNDIFFTVDWGTRDSTQDVGWRPGYTREKTTVYTMKVGGDQITELYSY